MVELKRSREPTTSGAIRSKNVAETGSVAFPEYSHQQYVILGMLDVQDVSGMELRKRLLASTGRECSSPAFYQLMSRMVTSKLVEAFDVDVKVNRYVAKERRYRILPLGENALRDVKRFYREGI